MTHAHSSQAQLTAEELQQMKWLLGGVLTLLSVATVFYLDVEAWTLLALTAMAVVAGLIRPGWPARVPRLVHRLAFPVVAAVFSADLWLSGELLPAMVRLDILLLLYRAIIYRQRRDDLQIIVLGLFLLVVAGVLSVSLTFAVHILAFTACALTFLFTITLSAASEGAAASGEKAGLAGEVPAWARQVSWRRLLRRVREVTNWRVVALGGALFAGLVMVSGLLFLAIPRFQLENSFFLERFISKKAKSGFSDSIRFGDVTEITLDESVALSVDVSDRSAVPTEPYWRMMVLDEYREGTFRLSTGLRIELGAEQGRMTLLGTLRGRGGQDVHWTFYLESGVSRYLPLLGRFNTLQFTERQNYRYGQSIGVVALRDDPVRMTAYRVAGMDNGVRLPDPGFVNAWRDRRPTIAQMLRLNVSETDVTTLERIVREIAGERGGGERSVKSGGGVLERAGISTEEFLRRAEAWLEGRHAYSLRPRIPEGAGDPLVRWLASEEGGHCELFAGSLVLLARAAGLPARVVTGFRGGSWNGYSNHFTLRNSDAHAWCEVFDRASATWLRADPTPGSSAGARDETSGEAALAQRLDRSWTARLDSLRVFWYRRIVSFDQQSQLETIRAVKDVAENSGKWLRGMLERFGRNVKTWLSSPWDGRRMAEALAGMLALAAIGWLGWARPWRVWRKTSRGKARVSGAVRREAGCWLARWPVAEDETTMAIRGELERLRFGAPESWGEPRVVFEKARRQWRVLKRPRRKQPVTQER
jgi:transglutaminase-like putative cysteine protease